MISVTQFYGALLIWIALATLVLVVVRRKKFIRFDLGDACGSLLKVSSVSAVGVFLVVAFLSVDEFKDGEVIVNRESGEVVQTFTRGMVVFKQGYPYLDSERYARFIPSEEIVEVDMGVDPITDNPKVRHLRYSVVLRASADPIVWWKIDKSERERGEEISRQLKRLLYEFNEAHSRELAKFYNPLDDAQQEEFASIVREAVQPLLDETGMELRSATFSLPTN